MANSYDAAIEELITNYRETRDETLHTKIIAITERFISDIIKNDINAKGYDKPLLYKLGLMGLEDAINTINFEHSSFIPYVKYCIREKIQYFIDKHPTPFIQHEKQLFIDRLVKEYNLLVDEDDYVTIRLILEKLPIKVKKCILYHFGYYYNRVYSNEEIAERLHVDVDTIKNALEVFKGTILELFPVKTPEEPKELKFKNQGN